MSRSPSPQTKMCYISDCAPGPGRRPWCDGPASDIMQSPYCNESPEQCKNCSGVYAPWPHNPAPSQRSPHSSPLPHHPAPSHRSPNSSPVPSRSPTALPLCTPLHGDPFPLREGKFTHVKCCEGVEHGHSVATPHGFVPHYLCKDMPPRAAPSAPEWGLLNF